MQAERPPPRPVEQVVPASVYRRDWKRFVLDLVRVPHIRPTERRHGMVCPVTPANRSAFDGTQIGQFHDDGTPVGFAIAEIKSRRVHATTRYLGFDCWASAVVGLPTVLITHVARRDVMATNSRQFNTIYEHARAQRPDVVSAVKTKRRGQSGEWEEWVFENGGTFTILTGGKTVGSADDAGRSSGAQVIHITEAGQLRYGSVLYEAIKGSSDLDTLWLVAEGTAPRSRDHWFYQNWLKSYEGRGIFNEAWFLAWFHDPLKRLRRGSPQYQQVMDGDLESEIQATRPDLIDEEIGVVADHGLDDEQIAWRRAQFWRASDALAEMKARREYLETHDGAFKLAGGWLAEPIKRRIKATQRSSALRETTFGDVTARLYTTALAANQHAVCGVDSQEGGLDHLAAEIIDWQTGDLLGEAIGHGQHEDMASAVAWMLRQMVGQPCREYRLPTGELSRVRIPSHRYTLAVERNRGKGIAPCLEREGLTLWSDPFSGGSWGYITSKSSRPILFDRIHAAISDPDNPSRVYSPILGAQLCLVDWDHDTRRLDVSEGHDDALMAYGGAHYARSLVTPHVIRSEIGPLTVDISRQSGLDAWAGMR